MALGYDGDFFLEKNESIDGLFSLDFVPYNAFDQDVVLQIKVIQNFNTDALSDHSLQLTFVDDVTGDVIYDFTGTFSADENDPASIVSKMLASEEFASVELSLNSDDIGDLNNDSSYNPINTLARQSVIMSLPTLSYEVADLYDTLISQDYPANVMYMYFNGTNLDEFMAVQRVANKLNIRAWVEFPPDLSIDQAIDYANNLAPNDAHIAFLYAPIVARPSGATGLKGRKVPRTIGGALLSRYVLRSANINSNGIPAIHRPIAGYDYPFTLPGIAQAPGILLDDTARKRLADARINVLQRQVTTNGIRFIIGDVLTTYQDKNSLLALVNASEVSMYIDNNIIEIVKRHLLKPTENTISDSLRDCTKFLANCTTSDRRLLTQSDQIGGQFYALSITPTASRPHDAVDVELAYHPQGATRAAYLRTTVTAA